MESLNINTTYQELLDFYKDILEDIEKEHFEFHGLFDLDELYKIIHKLFYPSIDFLKYIEEEYEEFEKYSPDYVNLDSFEY